jgi:hypothetical protein
MILVLVTHLTGNWKVRGDIAIQVQVVTTSYWVLGLFVLQPVLCFTLNCYPIVFPSEVPGDFYVFLLFLYPAFLGPN